MMTVRVNWSIPCRERGRECMSTCCAGFHPGFLSIGGKHSNYQTKGGGGGGGEDLIVFF